MQNGTFPMFDLHTRIIEEMIGSDTHLSHQSIIRGNQYYALRSGRIRAIEDGLPDTVGTGTHEPNDDPTIDRFDQYDKLLTDHEWARFEGLQYQFRLDIANKRHGKSYNFIHPNPIKWWKLIKLLTSIFIRGGEFQPQKPNHGEYSTSFLKYVYRILSKFPIPDMGRQPLPNNADKNWYLSKIQYGLDFARNIIQPYVFQH